MAERGRIRTSDTVACVPHRSAVALGHSATSPRGFAPPFSRLIADHAMRGKRWVAYCGKTVGGEGRVSNPRAPWALPAGALDQLGHPLLFLVAHALFVAATGTNNSRVRATAGPKNFRLRGWPIVPRFGARRGIRASAPLSFTTAPSSRQVRVRSASEHHRFLWLRHLTTKHDPTALGRCRASGASVSCRARVVGRLCLPRSGNAGIIRFRGIRTTP